MSKPQSEFQWVKALRHTETALDLCAASVRREFDLEAELLFRKGNMQLISPQYSYTCVVYIVHRGLRGHYIVLFLKKKKQAPLISSYAAWLQNIAIEHFLH